MRFPREFIEEFGADINDYTYREALEAREFCLNNIESIKQSKDWMIENGSPDNDWYSRVNFKLAMYRSLTKRLNRYIKYREKLMAEEQVRLRSVLNFTACLSASIEKSRKKIEIHNLRKEIELNRERCFIAAARETLGKEIYMSLWKRVDEIQEFLSAEDLDNPKEVERVLEELNKGTYRKSS